MTLDGKDSSVFSWEASHGLRLGETWMELEGQAPDLGVRGSSISGGPHVLDGAVSFPGFLWFFLEASLEGAGLQRRAPASRLGRTQHASARGTVFSSMSSWRTWTLPFSWCGIQGKKDGERF